MVDQMLPAKMEHSRYLSQFHQILAQMKGLEVLLLKQNSYYCRIVYLGKHALPAPLPYRQRHRRRCQGGPFRVEFSSHYLYAKRVSLCYLYKSKVMLASNVEIPAKDQPHATKLTWPDCTGFLVLTGGPDQGLVISSLTWTKMLPAFPRVMRRFSSRYSTST